jgi:hypothetical protein
MKTAMLFILLAAPLAVAQSTYNCSQATQTPDGSTFACNSDSPTQSNTVYPATGSATWIDNCQTGGSTYYTATSTVTGNGACLYGSPKNAWIDCPFQNTTQVTSPTSSTGYNMMYNYAYDVKMIAVVLPGNNLSSTSCPQSGAWREDVKQCTSVWCVACSGNPGFVCALDGGDGGSGSPTCTAQGDYTCNGANECETPPSQYVCNEGEYGSASCGPSGWYCYTGDSPIIIDTDGTGFHLTNFQGGVRFDITGDGKPQQISWTAAGSTNGWLALPHDGKVTSGKQLFGNFTPQPPSDNPNGFLALAVYDQPENGGNADGVIDWHDAVWPNLRIWIDKNHDGIAQPDELFTLPSLGINSLAVAYVNSKYVDQFGNQFRDKGRLNPDGVPPTDHVDRTIYDVFLLSGQSGTQDARKPAAFDKTITATEHALN